MTHTIQVIINSDRPDFRTVWIFLWGENHDIDSDGDSSNPASRTWTQLYMKSREEENELFEIYPIEENPLIFEVASENIYLANRVAYFLCRETKGKLIDGHMNENNCNILENELGDFNLAIALKRADECIWRKSSLENPYPNLP